MKLEIDKQVLDVTKKVIISTVVTLKGLAHSETNLINKTLLNSCVDCLKQAHNNLELAHKPKPIRKVGIISK